MTGEAKHMLYKNTEDISIPFNDKDIKLEDPVKHMWCVAQFSTMCII